MSRTVRIQGKVFIEYPEIAKRVLQNGVRIVGNSFELETYDDYIAASVSSPLQLTEQAYRQEVQDELRRQEEQRIRLEDEARQKEVQRCNNNKAEVVRQMELMSRSGPLAESSEQDALRISAAAAEERAQFQEERKNQVIQNARRHGYRVKKTTTEKGVTRLVLQRRVY